MTNLIAVRMIPVALVELLIKGVPFLEKIFQDVRCCD